MMYSTMVVRMLMQRPADYLLIEIAYSEAENTSKF